MEWSKIKTLFIYLFLGLNIILVSIYGYTVYKNKAEVYKEKDEIIKSLQSNNITIIEPTIKKDVLGYVNATVKTITSPVDIKGEHNYETITQNDITKLSVTTEKVLANINKDNYKELLSTFLNTEVSKTSYYVFDSYDENKKNVTYRQAFEGLKIYDNNNAVVNFQVEDNGDIVSFTQTSLDDFKQENVGMIANYRQAVYKLYHENYIPNNSEVVSEIGYYTYISQLTNQVLIPTWRIEVKTDGKVRVYYVDAFNIKILNK
ncbi:two-component system regulatory protein YycI [Gemella sp. GH3]|uniref:two-component system regulatory protein YycI n=1 Tax=unclassified Gemella TaxID=2624949 RepID=UPI0015CFB52B|nr:MULTISPECIES: two-component system regulatory protein YycI [unclassified Gemella]MBF0714598.1 two-component system regulatory protein YycI [Gemella sp. GH3.1]NYS51550.1 two-component system regulatory protein YycI [Gemella sp. GH3]